MNKKIFISGLLISTAIFVSCSQITKHPSFPYKAAEKQSLSYEPNVYGAYLSGRIAHLRKDFNNATKYYQVAFDKDPSTPKLIDQLYLLLASQGKIDEAYKYAQKAIEQNTNNNFAHMLIATKQLHDSQHALSIKNFNNIDEPIYISLVVPMLNTWNYAGLNNHKKAFSELEKIKKQDGLLPIYTLHKAMLHDFLGQNREAAEIYHQILTDKNSELSVRMLEIITNFYVRTGQKDKALAIMDTTINNQALDSLLTNLRLRLKKADKNSTKPILSSAQIGAAEALFTIASTFRYDDIIDIAHMFTALAVYMNPRYSTAKVLMADIYEIREMYNEANNLYDSINPKDIAYYAAQFKKARNLIKQEDYENAEQLLKKLNKDYDDLQIYMELGDILRINNRFNEAIKYYDKAIAKTKKPVNLWVLYYAKGVSQERAGLWDDAEDTLLKAYKIKQHYLVLNHLGYSWIRQKQNIDEAFDMIVNAYNQAPFDPSINDSLGFALYNLGYYAMSIPYLERAAELFPSSAIISSHLGDAYWFAHRKNEAKFQWQHALKLKDDSGELNIDDTKNKIENGLISEPTLTYNKEKIEETIKKIKKQNHSRRL